MKTRLMSDFAVRQVERAISGWILSGRYAEDERLPGLAELAEELGVAEVTVSRAVGRLRARRLVRFEPGVGVVVSPLDECAGIELLGEMIEHCDARWRRFALRCQFYDFLRPQLADWAERAAMRRTDDQLIWLEHYTTVLEGPPSDRASVGRAEFELGRVLAAAAENPCFTLTMNAFQPLFESEVLVQGTDSLIPAEAYRELYEAVKAHDSQRAGQAIEAALWNRELECIAELRKLGWTTAGAPLTSERDEETGAA